MRVASIASMPRVHAHEHMRMRTCPFLCLLAGLGLLWFALVCFALLCFVACWLPALAGVLGRGVPSLPGPPNNLPRSCVGWGLLYWGCFALLCFALLCFALLCFAWLALLCPALLCFALLCFALLCFDLFRFASLCFALLCFVLLRFALRSLLLGGCWLPALAGWGAGSGRSFAPRACLLAVLGPLCFALLCFALLCFALCSSLLCLLAWLACWLGRGWLFRFALLLVGWGRRRSLCFALICLLALLPCFACWLGGCARFAYEPRRTSLGSRVPRCHALQTKMESGNLYTAGGPSRLLSAIAPF
jgi:hypothetical protein